MMIPSNKSSIVSSSPLHVYNKVQNKFSPQSAGGEPLMVPVYLPVFESWTTAMGSYIFRFYALRR